MKINKAQLNLSIDMLMFILMVPIAGIGFLIKYVLVPGFKRNAIYGRDVELYYWGMDRHQWGAIHLILSFILLFLLLLHIVFHWKQIVGIFKRMVPVKALRVILSVLLVIFTFVFGISPFFLTPEIKENVWNHEEHSEKGKAYSSEERQHKKRIEAQPVIDKPKEAVFNENTPPKRENHQHKHRAEIEIYGNMTINDVAQKYNVSAQELAKIIHVPDGHNNERLGRLRKSYPFQLNDLRDFIESEIKLKAISVPNNRK
ncbi:DUF4405 domain-containing protein [Saccharicrinis fermentans]|uniref:Flavinylation-associated cytochrome domain-containing protein n=1 Tax=Saccharicrinis fermentans DSM 9555 = JCM 21142 TaxID=869213 RepID=W7XW09_9BACT|nr:DUF4405 domain-containing protein [Saccharicrinis fermentans]GAF02450.1 hypothetical protein JCM21142_31085 [Saccharicrinis fermentans DSM 9555 = JCM 21142]